MEAPKRFRLMCVLAHPDDESLGMGGTLAKYAAEGVETYVVTASKGEGGRSGSKEPLTLEAVGHLRDAELRAAAAELGVREVSLLGYCDGELDQANPTEAIGKIVAQVPLAISCHQSQMAVYQRLSDLSEEHHRSLWGSQEFYRAMSLVNGGRRVESDLFEGLRETSDI